MAASRADRTAGNYTVFENGVYTACAPCKDDPKKPPLWQVKGARIIHDQKERMLYFENAQLEFFGVPMAYLPYFSTPDPTVKRKTGFLMPSYTLGLRLRLRRGHAVLLGDRARLRHDHHPALHHQARRAGPGRVPPAAAGRRLPDPRLRHRPARPERLRRPARRPPVPRRHRHQGPVLDQRQMGLGLGRRAAVRLLLLLGLPAGAVQRSARLVPEPADGSDLAALSDRRRQSQLLRCADDLLPELLRQPGQGAGDPSGDRLQQRPQPPGLRRRAQLQDQFHESVARPPRRSIRSRRSPTPTACA